MTEHLSKTLVHSCIRVPSSTITPSRRNLIIGRRMATMSIEHTVWETRPPAIEILPSGDIVHLQSSMRISIHRGRQDVRDPAQKRVGKYAHHYARGAHCGLRLPTRCWRARLRRS